MLYDYKTVTIGREKIVQLEAQFPVDPSEHLDTIVNLLSIFVRPL
jgi:hypothetical protein